ncbi:MAG: hypothetical protein LBU76_10870 [Azoarcus sp.]|jgi:hypothetical protein|nr:hypothetical protein [Azoarcus sp.]
MSNLTDIQPWQSIRHHGEGFMATAEQFEHDLTAMYPLAIDTHEIDKSRLMQQFFPAVTEVRG